LAAAYHVFNVSVSRCGVVDYVFSSKLFLVKLRLLLDIAYLF